MCGGNIPEEEEEEVKEEAGGGEDCIEHRHKPC